MNRRAMHHPPERTLQSVFFYGSFISLDVLAEHDFAPATATVASLDGYDIVLAPYATLVQRTGSAVYGLLVTAPAADVEHLYADQWLAAYAPFTVSVRSAEGVAVDALCYIAPASETSAADRAYLQRIVDAARGHGFPAAYLAHLDRLVP